MTVVCILSSGSVSNAIGRPVTTHPTDWEPAHNNPKLTLNIVLDGCIVPTASGAARVDYSHLVVLDNFFEEDTRQQLLDYLTEPGWSGSDPPSSNWDQANCDGAGRPRTWGLSRAALQQFATTNIPAKLEVQSRLCKMYPDMIIAHMPSDQIQVGPTKQQQQRQQQLTDDGHSPGQQQQQRMEDPPPCHPHAAHQPPLQQQQQQQQQEEDVSVDCSCFLANAAVAGDSFSWHVDADPMEFPVTSPWSQQYGTYCNREPGRPLFVSLLLYLDANWPLNHDAETLFLDNMTDTGVFIRPKQYRAVLLDQDISHRLSTPSASAGRPRYSLVWKLVMFPKQPGGRCSIAKPEWGKPTHFGSAAQVERAVREVAAAAGDGDATRKRKAAPEQQHV